jgi:hypothetical protein
MSERDSVHKEIEKLQDEVQDSKKKAIMADSRAKHYDEEVCGLCFLVKINFVQRKIHI